MPVNHFWFCKNNTGIVNIKLSYSINLFSFYLCALVENHYFYSYLGIIFLME